MQWLFRDYFFNSTLPLLREWQFLLKIRFLWHKINMIFIIILRRCSDFRTNFKEQRLLSELFLVIAYFLRGWLQSIVWCFSIWGTITAYKWMLSSNLKNLKLNSVTICYLPLGHDLRWIHILIYFRYLLNFDYSRLQKLRDESKLYFMSSICFQASYASLNYWQELQRW